MAAKDMRIERRINERCFVIFVGEMGDIKGICGGECGGCMQVNMGSWWWFI